MCPGREIDAYIIIEHQGLWRLGELNAVIRQRVLRWIKDLAEFFPLHRFIRSIQFTIQQSQAEAMPSDTVAKIGQPSFSIQ